MGTRVLCQWNTHLWLSKVDLVLRWRQLYEAAPGKHTSEALSLLEETAKLMAPCETTWENTSAPVALSERETSLLVWKTLRRQRVPWEAALSLAQAQLSCISPAQRGFIMKGTAGRPWSFSHAVLASWDMQDPSLVPVYRGLKRAETVVTMSQRVAAALRSRPELRQKLPVPAAVMRHFYTLALSDNGTDADTLSLALRSHLSLLGDAALSAAEKEAFALDEAHLHARTGDWATALRLVTSSNVTRLSEKERFANYVKLRDLHKESDRLSPALVPTGIAHAPTWREAHDLLQLHLDMDAAKVAFLSREDVSRAAEEASLDAKSRELAELLPLTWEAQLAVFRSLSPPMQSFRVLRPILERIPATRSDYILVCTEALGPVASRMYAGTLTRRFHSLRQQGRLAAAVALCCGAGYYDVASEVASQVRFPTGNGAPLLGAPSGSASHVEPTLSVSYELPESLLRFNKTVAMLKQPRVLDPSSNKADTSIPLDGQLSLPELLAHALYGDWQRVAEVLHDQAETGAAVNARLYSLVCAKRRESQRSAGRDGGDVGIERGQCFTFAALAVTRLVCANAAEKDQRYFAKVIPGALLAHHFDAETRGALTGKTVTPIARAALGGKTTDDVDDGNDADAFEQFLYAPTPVRVETVADCQLLLQGITAHLRQRGGDDYASGKGLLRAVSRACATGQVRLRTADAYGLALEVLKASCLLGSHKITKKAGESRVDSLVATSAVQSVPSRFLDACAPAVAAGVNALLLTGNVRIVMAVYRRWSRKEKEGSESIPVAVAALEGSPKTDASRHLANTFLRAAYYLPKKDAQKWAVLLWRNYHQPTALILQELLVGDTRQTADLLRASSRKPSSGRQRSGSRERLTSQFPHNTPSLLERRRLMGMAFCALDTTPALRFVVRASGKAKITAVDVDEHGLQRLLRALPGASALAALAQLADMHPLDESVDELWLLIILCKPDHESVLQAVDAVSTLVAATRSSSLYLLANCHCELLRSLGHMGERANPGQALKALLRFTNLTVTTYSGSVPVLYGVLSVMLKQFSESLPVAARLLELEREEGAALAELHRVSHRILNQLLSQRDLEALLRKERREMTQLLRRPEATSPVLLLGWLHHALSRRQCLPVAASFTSYLLRLAAEHTSDWRTAFHVFSWLRYPTNAERLLLLGALEQHCRRDLSARVRYSRGLLLASPELALVWADTGQWDAAPSAGITASESGNPEFLRRVRLSQSVVRKEIERDSIAGAPPPRRIADETQELANDWSEQDCERAERLLIRLGWAKEDGIKGEQEQRVLPAGDNADYVSDVLRVIQRQKQHLKHPRS